MAKIRHIALSTQDPDKTAKFYIDVFGLKQVGRVDSPGASGYYLTDGDINLAILKFKSDAVAGVERGKDWSGLHHFGFQVDDIAATQKKIEARGGKFFFDLGHDQEKENFERKFKDPDGIIFDISKKGWLGTK